MNLRITIWNEERYFFLLCINKDNHGRLLNVFSSDTMHFFVWCCVGYISREEVARIENRQCQTQTKNCVEETSTPRELRTYVNGLRTNNTGAVFGMVVWRDQTGETSSDHNPTWADLYLLLTFSNHHTHNWIHQQKTKKN